MVCGPVKSQTPRRASRSSCGTPPQCCCFGVACARVWDGACCLSAYCLCAACMHATHITHALYRPHLIHAHVPTRSHTRTLTQSHPQTNTQPHTYTHIHTQALRGELAEAEHGLALARDECARYQAELLAARQDLGSPSPSPSPPHARGLTEARSGLSAGAR